MSVVFDWIRARFAPPPPRPERDPDPDLDRELGPFHGPLLEIPRTRRGVYLAFGNPGVGKVDPKWERANMVGARGLPGSWNKGSRKLYVHRLAEPYLREALRRCQVLECLDEIDWLGCFSFRHQRHDSARPLSFHSWGIAVDINSGLNAGWYAKNPPKPWSVEWKAHYPHGVTPDLVLAFESCGWKWGGRWSGYCDPMHFELTT